MPDQPIQPMELPPSRRMSRERFEALLYEIRNGATIAVTERAIESLDREHAEALLEDARAVWHTAEVALGILHPGYLPKREALTDVRRMLAWVDHGDLTWLRTD